jgi:hypothetical protein
VLKNLNVDQARFVAILARTERMQRDSLLDNVPEDDLGAMQPGRSAAMVATSTGPGVTRRERPVGICPRCHAIVRVLDQLGKKCVRPLAFGTRCPAVIRSALSADEWTECPNCRATGR